MSPITKYQAVKILKALGYSFASGFVGVLTLVSLDFIIAAMSGKAAIVNLVTALLAASVIGGINAIFVTIKQFLTPVENSPVAT